MGSACTKDYNKGDYAIPKDEKPSRPKSIVRVTVNDADLTDQSSIIQKTNSDVAMVDDDAVSGCTEVEYIGDASMNHANEIKEDL